MSMKYNFQFFFPGTTARRAGYGAGNFQSRAAAQPQRGFTILLAALIASLVLALGISVFSIAQKQLILSSTGRNSQLAFYAADTGAECALFWDMRNMAFDPGAETQLTPIGCDGDLGITVTHTDLPPGNPTDRYEFDFDPNGYCVQVTVEKNTVHPRTRIHADGFSVPCADIDTSSRALQRSVELTY